MDFTFDFSKNSDVIIDVSSHPFDYNVVGKIHNIYENDSSSVIELFYEIQLTKSGNGPTERITHESSITPDNDNGHFVTVYVVNNETGERKTRKSKTKIKYGGGGEKQGEL